MSLIAFAQGSETGLDNITDERERLAKASAVRMESVRLRLLWAVAAGGDEGICASCAIAVIRFAETSARPWSDKNLRMLHRRLCKANGVGCKERFVVARRALTKTLFLPL